ncbi:MAG: acyl-CoA dehydrogenase family protein [Candidatus Dormiibacterota bacterium]
MDFGLSPEQELLRGQARDFLDRASPSSAVRRALESDGGWDAAVWRQMVELGWTAIPFSTEVGGLGLGLVELAVVLEEQGRHLTPSPFHSSVCLAGAVTAAAPDSPFQRELLGGIAAGSTRATVALLESSGRWDAAGVRLRAELSGDAYRLRGEKLYVPDARDADWIIVAARTEEDAEDGVTLMAIDRGAPGVTVARLRSLDPTRNLARLGFDDVEVDVTRVLGTPGHGFSTLRRALDVAAVAVSAELCGVAQRAMELSVEHAKNRRQFGRPIGSYQAISHRCADMLVQVESARSLTYHAAWALEHDQVAAPLAVSMAKAYAGDAARWVTSTAIQVHGGIGFTWEHDAHLLFKRAKWGEVMYGDGRHHRERVAQRLEL